MTLLQVKARGAQRLKKFMVRMKVKPDLNAGPDSTIVTGFEYMGEVEDTVIDSSKVAEIQQTIKNIIEEDGHIKRQDALKFGFAEATVDRAFELIVESGEYAKEKKGVNVTYRATMFPDKNAVIEEFSNPLA